MHIGCQKITIGKGGQISDDISNKYRNGVLYSFCQNKKIKETFRINFSFRFDWNTLTKIGYDFE